MRGEQGGGRGVRGKVSRAQPDLNLLAPRLSLLAPQCFMVFLEFVVCLELRVSGNEFTFLFEDFGEFIAFGPKAADVESAAGIKPNARRRKVHTGIQYVEQLLHQSIRLVDFLVLGKEQSVSAKTVLYQR